MCTERTKRICMSCEPLSLSIVYIWCITMYKNVLNTNDDDLIKYENYMHKASHYPVWSAVYHYTT